MWKVISSKMFWLYAVAVFAVLAIFSFAQIGARNSVELKQLPIAVVNNSGDKQSKAIIDKLEDKFDDDDAQLKLINVKNNNKLQNGLDDKKYYGALVIDKNFDKNLAGQQNYLKGLVIQAKTKDLPKEAIAGNPQLKAQTEAAAGLTKELPYQANVKIITNQGMNATASSAVTAALPKMIDGLSSGVSQKLQGALSENKVTLSPEQWQTINQPITSTTKVMNKIPNKSVSGMAPLLMIVLSWMGALIGAILLWREHKKHADQSNGRFTAGLVTSQVVTGVVLSAIVSLTIYFFAHTCFDVPVPDAGSFLLTVGFGVFIFYLIQTFILDWLGFAGAPIVVIIMLLSMGVLTYPKEMLTPLFANGIYSWTPLRFPLDMITNNLYISGTPASNMTDIIVLSCIGVGSIIFMYLSMLKKPKAKK